MAFLFSYTECEAPGPFQPAAGFKIKSVSSSFGADLTPSDEKIFNQVISKYPAFDPPRVDPYSSREEFDQLPKLWVYEHVAEGVFAFSRLATSGTMKGRPGNPFHQSFVFRYREVGDLIARSQRESGPAYVVPADFFFWNWPNPRGDKEVESANLEDKAAPIPLINEFEMLFTWEELLGGSNGNASVRAFESKLLSRATTPLPSAGDKDFFALAGFLTRLIPAEVAWATELSQVGRRRQDEVDTSLPAPLTFSETDLEAASYRSVGWSELVFEIVEHGLQLDAMSKMSLLSELFAVDLSQERQALTFLPIACAVVIGELEAGNPNLARMAWQVLREVDYRLELKSDDALRILIDLIRNSAWGSEPDAVSWFTNLSVRRR